VDTIADDKFVRYLEPDIAGLEIDFAQRNRNLPFIGKVRFVEEA
ncbi:MAG: hypoxanthine phosphoribosyltransferase, partial [Pseudomonadota bacterium]